MRKITLADEITRLGSCSSVESDYPSLPLRLASEYLLIEPRRFLLQDNEQLITLVHLTDYNVYRIPNAKRCFGAPFAWGACLRPNSNAEAEDTEAGESGLKVIAFDSEKSRACWLTAMRLAKVSGTFFSLPRPRSRKNGDSAALQFARETNDRPSTSVHLAAPLVANVESCVIVRWSCTT